MKLSSILGWNTRDLNKRVRQNSVRDIILSSHTNIVCLQETKLATVSSQLLTVFGSAFDKFVTLPTDGSRGGILITWKGACCHEFPLKWTDTRSPFSLQNKTAGTGGLPVYMVLRKMSKSFGSCRSMVYRCIWFTKLLTRIMPI